MEEKKSNKRLIVIAILLLLIGGVGGYFVSTNFLNKDKVNNKNNTLNEKTTNENYPTVENNEVIPCKYEKLKNVSQLTHDEKYEINEQVIEYANIHVSGNWKSINDYMYSIDFSTGDLESEGTTIYVIVWRENNQWKRSEYFSSKEELMNNLPNTDICK